jgi:hypothetical protein
MSQAAFYSWAVPAFVSGAPVDHTWVTTYDNRINPYPDDQTVANANQSYWYCWGSFHPQGETPSLPDGFLGAQTGNLAHAQCLVLTNANSQQETAACGTIFTYGIDGICHQLANQVLYATGRGGTLPLTVSNARGYPASSFVYGTYGLQHAAWANKQNICAVSQSGFIAPMGGDFTVLTQNEEFEQHVRAVLGPDKEELVTKLLALRTEAQTQQRADAFLLQNATPVTAQALNERNQQILDKAAKLLGDELFTKVFGFAPSEKINLVDPEIFAKNRYTKDKKNGS